MFVHDDDMGSPPSWLSRHSFRKQHYYKQSRMHNFSSLTDLKIHNFLYMCLPCSGCMLQFKFGSSKQLLRFHLCLNDSARSKLPFKKQKLTSFFFSDIEERDTWEKNIHEHNSRWMCLVEKYFYLVKEHALMQM